MSVAGPRPGQEHTRGLNLVEFLIVLVILAVIAAVTVFALSTTAKNAVSASCQADARSVETALSVYKAQMSSYPASIAELTLPAKAASGWAGPWLQVAPGTTHYVMFNDALGDLFVVPPGRGPDAPGATYTINGTLTAVATVGGAFDFDTDPAVCGWYS